MESDVILSLPWMLSRERAKAIAGSRTCHHACGDKDASPRRTREPEGRMVILTFPPGYVDALKVRIRRDGTAVKTKGNRDGKRDRELITRATPSRIIIIANYLIRAASFLNMKEEPCAERLMKLTRR